MEGNTHNKFYTCKKVLSYNTPFIFTLGNRSIGKTFGWTKRNIDVFLAKRRKFIYVRRYEEDLKRVAPSFFDAVAFKFPGHEFAVKGNGKSGTIFRVDGMVAGMTIALSTATKFKSISLPDYDTIMFDEFLTEDDTYLPDEVGKALGLYQTVARGDGKPIRPEVKFVFIANNVSMNNPYFRELKIRERIRPGTKYTVDTDRAWVVELTNNAEIANEIVQTPFGKMIAKTRYGDFALKSEFYLDNNNFVEKPSGDSRYLCTLQYMGKQYGVYDYYNSGFVWISTKVDKKCKLIFALTTNDHQPNYTMLYKAKYNDVIRFMQFAFENALMRFDNGDSKSMFMDFMSLLG